MHIPKLFNVTDQKVIETFIKENGFATLISIGSIYPNGTHIPIELKTLSDGRKVLHGHISKANLQWQDFENNKNVLVIFLSPVHSYISSSWYNQPNAPTWNYLSVHVTGKLKVLEGEELWDSVRKLTNRYEQNSSTPVSLDTLPESVQKQMHGIVGFEISIDKMEAAFKLSQNRTAEDFENIIKELSGSDSLTAKMMANEMEKNRSPANPHRSHS